MCRVRVLSVAQAIWSVVSRKYVPTTLLVLFQRNEKINENKHFVKTTIFIQFMKNTVESRHIASLRSLQAKTFGKAPNQTIMVFEMRPLDSVQSYMYFYIHMV